jgi:hypothetical protein
MILLRKIIIIFGISAAAAAASYADLSDTLKTIIEPVQVDLSTLVDSFIIATEDKHLASVDFDTKRDGFNDLKIIYFIDILNVNLLGPSSITGLVLIGYGIDANNNHEYEHSEISISESYYKLYKKAFEEIFPAVK